MNHRMIINFRWIFLCRDIEFREKCLACINFFLIRCYREAELYLEASPRIGRKRWSMPLKIQSADSLSNLCIDEYTRGVLGESKVSLPIVSRKKFYDETFNRGPLSSLIRVIGQGIFLSIFVWDVSSCVSRRNNVSPHKLFPRNSSFHMSLIDRLKVGKFRRIAVMSYEKKKIVLKMISSRLIKKRV